MNLSEVANIVENFENPNIPGNNNLLVHRFFRAVNIDGETYRVKTTIKEYRNEDHPKLYSFEVTEIELPDSEEPSSKVAPARDAEALARAGATKIEQNFGTRKLSGKKENNLGR